MAQNKCSEIIQVVHPICCGLDVYKEIVTACLLTMNPAGQVREHNEEFGTYTDELIHDFSAPS